MKNTPAYKRVVGERLRKFGENNFENLNVFARKLGIEPGNLHSAYLKGRSLPGADLLFKLLKLGCDIAWLLNPDTIETDLPKEHKYTKEQSKLIVKELENEKYELAEELIKLKKKVTEYEKLHLRIIEFVPEEHKVGMSKSKSS